MSFHEITQYRLVIHDKQRRYNFPQPGGKYPDAQIIIWTIDGYYMRIFFMPNDEPLAEHYEEALRKNVNVFLYSRQYTWCVDMLRNEGQQQAWWDGNNFFLSTGPEPLGSGDEV